MIRRIHRVGGPDISGPRDCCVYLIDADSPVLIDAGFGDNVHKLVDNIGQVGVDPSTIKSIVLTHCHIDHIGGADQLRKLLGARLFMHSLDAAIIERGDNRLTAAFCFEINFKPLHIDVLLHNSRGRIPELEEELYYLHTPGHTAGSISPYVDINRMRILFGQDLGAPLLTEFDCDPVAWRHSMEQLLALKADVLCDGHSGVYSPAGRVEAYIRRFVRLYSNKIVKKGGTSF
jgi:glyoxylase-like metal-dependent hydrolase (beta-lactamase superfamily II)